MSGYLHERFPFEYTDDYGREFIIILNDYIGQAGGLTRMRGGGLNQMGKAVHARHVRVRSIEPEANGKKHYKDIPVNKTSTLWTGPLAQRITIYEQEFETVKKVDEIEYGRKGAAEERRLIKKRELEAARNTAPET